MIYQFVWHNYCDWYLELSKTILYSDDKKSIDEVRLVSGYIFREILVLMHPFIPFVTEEIWLKNKLDKSGKVYLMHSNWINGKAKKDKDYANVEKIIEIVSTIRSFKNEINVSPGSFIDISLSKIGKSKKDFFVKNESIVKKLGRINNFSNKDLDKPSATIIIDGDLFKIYFDQDVDLKTIKDNLVQKQDRYSKEMNSIDARLKNKNFVERAPKHIVEQEKNNYNNLKNDINKISITIKNL